MTFRLWRCFCKVYTPRSKRFLYLIIPISFLATYFHTLFSPSIRLLFAPFSDLVSEVSQESNLAKIHINTISSYNGFGGGIYKMTSIKELKGTKDFLAMDRKSCAIEAYQDCVDRNILQKCQCNLWEVTLSQVDPFLQCIKKFVLFLISKLLSGKESVQPSRERLY